MAIEMKTLGEIADALSYSREFYLAAAERAKQKDLAKLFRDLAQARGRLLEDLQRLPSSLDMMESDHRLLDQLRTLYDEATARWRVREDFAFLEPLVIGEDEILHVAGNVLVNSDLLDVREVVRTHLEALIQGHRNLSKLQNELNHRH